jgi:hypothetical protein
MKKLKDIVVGYFKGTYRVMALLFVISLLGSRDWSFKIAFVILGPLAFMVASLPLYLFLVIPSRRERRTGETRLGFFLRCVTSPGVRMRILPRPDKHHFVFVRLDCGHSMSINTLDPNHLLEVGKAMYCHGHEAGNTELHLITEVGVDWLDHFDQCGDGKTGCRKTLVTDSDHSWWSDPLKISSPLTNPFPKSEYQQLLPSS